MSTAAITALWLTAMLAVSSTVCAEPLVPPPGFAVAARVSDKDGHACPLDAALPYVGEMDFPSKFEGSDSARDDLNRKAEAEYQRRIAPIRAMERGLSQQVEDYLRSQRADSLDCALDLLRAWARADALRGKSSTHTGKSMRKWALGSIASAYLRLKFSASAPLQAHPQLVQEVEPWLRELAEQVVPEWDAPPLKKMNNHEYWAAWSVMAAAVALDRNDLFEWALAQLDIATGQIDARGYLPNELKRDTRALYYHNYALTPLTMMAAFAKANGQPLSKSQRAALDRLAQRVLSGVADPRPFVRITGKQQITADFTQRSKFAWMEPYCWTFACNAALHMRLAQLRPLKSYRLGGNVTDLFTPPTSSSKETVSWIVPFRSHPTTPQW